MRLGSTLAVSAPSYQVAGAGRALFAGSMTEDDMSLVGTGRATMLTALAGQITHVSLHTADPGDSGTSEVSGGSYARVAASWGTATATSVMLASTTWTIPAGTPTHVGFWTALSGGTFIGSARLANPSARSAGSFTVPSTVVYLDAGDILVSQGALDDFRLVLHNAGLLQAPLRLDSDCVLVVDPTGFYDAEQRCILNSSLVTSRTALAVGLGNAGCAGPIFHTDKYGSAMWLNQSLGAALMSCPTPTPTTAGVFTVGGVLAERRLDPGWTRFAYTTGGGLDVINFYFKAAGELGIYTPAGNVSAADPYVTLGLGDSDRLFWAVEFTASACTIKISADGVSWTTTASGALSRALVPGTRLYVGASFTSSAGIGSKVYEQWMSDGDKDAVRLARFLPGMFVGGNRADGDTAVDAHGVTWTIERPAATTDMPAVNTSGGVTYLTSDGVNDFAQVCGDDTITDFVPATGLTLVLDASAAAAVSFGWLTGDPDGGDFDGIGLRFNGTNPNVYSRLDDGTTIASLGDNANNITFGERFQFVAAHGSSDHEAFVDGATVESATNAVTAHSEPSAYMLFGIPAGSRTAYDLYGAAVVRRRLTDTSPPSEVQTIHTEGISA